MGSPNVSDSPYRLYRDQGICGGRQPVAKCREATKVRREWVKTLLSRKAAPKGWQHFTVHAITHDPETASGYDGKVDAEMIGAKTGEESDRWGWNPLRGHVAKTTARPEFALLALICAGYEKTIHKDSWRSAGQVHNADLSRLVAWGYKASEVEQIILDKHSAEETALEIPCRAEPPTARQGPPHDSARLNL